MIKKVFLNRQKTGEPNVAVPVFSFKHPLKYNPIGVGADLSRVFYGCFVETSSLHY